MPGPLELVTAIAPPNAAPITEHIAAISSSACTVRTPTMLERTQLLEDRTGRGNRIRAAVQLLAAQPGRGNQSPGQRLVAHDVPVGAGGQPGRLDLVAVVERLRRFPVVPAGAQRLLVGRRDLRLAPELLPDEPQRRLDLTPEQPVDQPQGEEVLAAILQIRAQAFDLPDRLAVQGVETNLDQAVVVDRSVLERIGLEPGQLQVLRLEALVVDDKDPALLEVRDIGDEGGRVHGDQRLQRIAGREDLARGELHLVSADAGQGAAGRADLGRKVGERGDVVAMQRRRVGELAPHHLHAVAGVAGQPDRRPVEPDGSFRGSRQTRGLRPFFGWRRYRRLARHFWVLAVTP